jgi:hypothetical protein
MIVPNISTSDFEKLPLRAIVALAARCARRVQTLGLLPDGCPDSHRCGTAIDAAIRLAEDFARGLPCPAMPTVIRDVETCRAIAPGEYVRETAIGAAVWATHAAAAAIDSLALRGEPAETGVIGLGGSNPFPQLANVAADLAARDAFTAAVDAAVAAGFGDVFIKQAMHDYDMLLKLRLGNYPDAGEPIDPSPAGPLGKL